MKEQGITGQSTEQKVQARLKTIHLESEKPKPDRGVDLEVWDSANQERRVRVQIKGRGKTQKNRRYRWFQIRATKKQRDDAVKDGFPVSDAWRKKVGLCDFFVLVSEKNDEYWVFPAAIIYEIVDRNKIIYRKRKDNILGKQAEMDLDIKYGGKPLTEIYKSYKNNFLLIKKKINSA